MVQLNKKMIFIVILFINNHSKKIILIFIVKINRLKTVAYEKSTGRRLFLFLFIFFIILFTLILVISEHSFLKLFPNC